MFVPPLEFLQDKLNAVGKWNIDRQGRERERIRRERRLEQNQNDEKQDKEERERDEREREEEEKEDMEEAAGRKRVRLDEDGGEVIDALAAVADYAVDDNEEEIVIDDGAEGKAKHKRSEGSVAEKSVKEECTPDIITSVSLAEDSSIPASTSLFPISSRIIASSLASHPEEFAASDQNDSVQLWREGWKERYYNLKYSMGGYDQTNINGVADNYLEGLRLFDYGCYDVFCI
jgi:5'-3' exonuclease